MCLPVLALNLKRFVLRELAHFREIIDPLVTLAHAGINIKDCICVECNTSIEEVRTLMKQHRFDVLPIRDKDGNVSEYFTTEKWSFYDEEIEKRKISTSDSIFYQTDLQTGISHLAATKRNFLFLESEGRTVGLFTISNLNAKEVFLKLYGMIVQLEKAMFNAIYSSCIGDHEIIDVILAKIKTGRNANNAKSSLKNYFEHLETSSEGRVLEYLFLNDIAFVFSEFGLHQKLGFASDYFLGCIAKIKNLRNVIAHPTQTIVNRRRSIEDLDHCLKMIDHLVLKMRHVFKQN